MIVVVTVINDTMLLSTKLHYSMMTLYNIRVVLVVCCLLFLLVLSSLVNPPYVCFLPLLTVRYDNECLCVTMGCDDVMYMGVGVVFLNILIKYIKIEWEVKKKRKQQKDVKWSWWMRKVSSGTDDSESTATVNYLLYCISLLLLIINIIIIIVFIIYHHHHHHSLLLLFLK